MARLKSDPAARGVIFLDPISSFAGTDTSGLLSSDGVHPNRQGDAAPHQGTHRLTSCTRRGLGVMNPAITEYAGILRMRWRWMVWGVLLAVGVTTLFLILQPPMYRSEQTVFVRTPGDVSQVRRRR